MVTILEERRFPVARLSLFASARSAGEVLEFRGEDVVIQDLAQRDRQESFDLVLFSAGSELSSLHAPEFAEAGAWVVDNSSAFRDSDDCPLIVPEINSHCLHEAKRRIVANPNCTTIALVQSLFPLMQLHRIKRVVVSTYQSVSGSGKQGMNELESQVRNLLNGIPPEVEVFPARIARQIQQGTLTQQIEICWCSNMLLIVMLCIAAVDEVVSRASAATRPQAI